MSIRLLFIVVATAVASATAIGTVATVVASANAVDVVNSFEFYGDTFKHTYREQNTQTNEQKNYIEITKKQKKKKKNVLKF